MGVYKHLLIEFCDEVSNGNPVVFDFVMEQVLSGNTLWCRYADNFINRVKRYYLF